MKNRLPRLPKGFIYAKAAPENPVRCKSLAVAQQIIPRLLFFCQCVVSIVAILPRFPENFVTETFSINKKSPAVKAELFYFIFPPVSW